jgi:hypothetical protein
MSGPQLSSRRPDAGSPSSRRPRGPLARVRRLGAVAGVLVVAGLGAGAPSAGAAPTSMVDLGDATTYGVISGASIGNTVSAPGAPHTVVHGDLGVKANTEPLGFPPGDVTGAQNVGNAAAAAAHADLVAAYDEVASRLGGTPMAGDLTGKTVTPGLYKIGAAVSNTGTLTLDAGGDPDAVFVFQVNAALAVAAGSHVELTNGARASRVFWQVNGAGAVGANATFAGTLMAKDAVGIGNGTILNGRALALNGALTLDANQIYGSPPAVAITGGATATTTDTTPTISGTTDIEGTDAVTVTVDGQTLTATPTRGAWSVTSPLLNNATYAVTAAVTDGAGNTTTATQDLTVDTELPVVTIDGGAAVLTDDATPTIGGTTDVDAGSTVRVSVGTQDRSALVHADGTWNVTPSTLTDGSRTVTATVTDPAGNEGTDTQELVVDTTAPALAVTGGATALTNDATPLIAGTADVPEGTLVTVDLADETLVAVVGAPAQSEGAHRITVRVVDPAGNPASATQRLTVDTISPLVSIDGGATATTSDLTPTITGTSDAAPGSTVTVTIAGQSMTTLVQAGGTWNATPTPVGPGSWTVEATVPDPAGNVGRATQTLTIGDPAPPPPGGGDTGGGGTPGGGGTGGGTGGTGTAGTATDAGTAPGAPSATAGTGGSGTPAGVTAPPTSSQPDSTPAPTAAAVLAATPAGKATVALGSRQRVTGSTLSIGTTVRASATGGVVASVKGTVRIKGVGKAIALTTATGRIAAGKAATLKVRPKGTRTAAAAAFRRIRAATRKGTAVTATITLRVVDAAGHVRTETRTVKLTK